MRKAKKPNWSLGKTIAAAIEALKLAKENQDELEARLGAGVIDGVAADLPKLQACETGRPAKVDEVKGLTGNEKDVAKRGAKLVSAIREAVKRRAGGSGLRKAVGVGSPVHAEQAKSVAAALETILKAAEERGSELRACGILEGDLKMARSIQTTLSGARGTQDQGMLSKKDLTKL